MKIQQSGIFAQRAKKLHADELVLSLLALGTHENFYHDLKRQ